MALIKQGSLATDIRGSIAGVTYARNRGGSYARGRTSPIQPNTPRQSLVRDIVAQLQTRFRATLTQAQRDGWEALASASTSTNRIGESIHLTALNHYIQVNSLRLGAGLAALDVAPAPPSHRDITDLTIAATVAAGVEITALAPALAVGDVLFVQTSGALSATRNFWKGPYPIFNYFLSTDVLPFTLVPPAQVVAGQRRHLRARMVDAAGRISTQNYYVANVI